MAKATTEEIKIFLEQNGTLTRDQLLLLNDEDFIRLITEPWVPKEQISVMNNFAKIKTDQITFCAYSSYLTRFNFERNLTLRNENINFNEKVRYSSS